LGTQVEHSIAELQELSRVYTRGPSRIVALDRVSLSLRAGEFLAVMGPSGSGKSTLLSLLGCLDKPTEGRYLLEGTDVGGLDDVSLSRLRNRSIGFVFQAFHLIPELTVLDNVATPLLYSGAPLPTWRPRAAACLGRVGLMDRAEHRPGELSGGEAQRAAIARALVMEPRMILADEPTGNLDSATGTAIAGLLVSLHAEGRTIVLVTHNEALAERAERVIRLCDGRVESDEAVMRP
jgi:putative ABC transport system ATP-binding protein